MAVVPVEYRRDEISIHSRKPLHAITLPPGRSAITCSMSGATGAKDIKEFFGEIELPLLANRPLASELNVNLSARYTKDRFYPASWTYSGKIGYRPIDWLLLRGTYGTSYRAPNVRNNFLKEQTGFYTLFDPCVVPENAWNGGNYDASLDDREPVVLANCRAAGVDPTTLAGGGNTRYSVEGSVGGVTDIKEETSQSMTIGFSVKQSWFEAFDFSFGGAYYEISIDDTIVEPSAQFMVSDCYANENKPDLSSRFCSRITRSDDNGLLNFVSRGLINRDNATARGMDINLNYGQSVTLFNRPVRLGASVTLNRLLERSTTFYNRNSVDFSESKGQFGFPKWTGFTALRAEWDNYNLTLSTRFIGSVSQDIPEFTNAFSRGRRGRSNTCLGPERGDINCRDVVSIDKYFVHSLSLYYRGDKWTIGGGVRNVLDTAPPRINGGRNNVATGYGYDLNGRTYFFNLGYNFGG